jgi:hypothetical protein
MHVGLLSVFPHENITRKEICSIYLYIFNIPNTIRFNKICRLDKQLEQGA